MFLEKYRLQRYIINGISKILYFLKKFQGSLLEINWIFVHSIFLLIQTNFVSSNFTYLKKKSIKWFKNLKRSFTKIKLATKYRSYRNPLRSSGRIFMEDDSNWITFYFAWCCLKFKAIWFKIKENPSRSRIFGFYSSSPWPKVSLFRVGISGGILIFP